MITTTRIVSQSPDLEKPLNAPSAPDKTVSLNRLKLPAAPKPFAAILLPRYMTVKLLQHESDTILMLHLADKQRIFVGRGDPELKHNLDIDLSGYGGRQRGISRLHADLRRTGHLLSIVDLNSTNGTYHNGTRLLPGHTQFLLSGDDVYFGNMQFQIYFGY